MLKIRLKRVGKKRDHSFRIIVTQAGKSITSGKYLDQIGIYDPRINKKDIDTDKAKKWLSDGAQPSDTVYNLLVDAGVIDGRKKNVLPQKSAPVVEVDESGSDATDATAEVSDDSTADDGDNEEGADDDSAEEQEESKE